MLNRIVHQYRITRQLGQGGMGVVYEAVHEGIGLHAAIKVLAPAIAADQKQVRRFLGEARAISKVEHPGLVRIFDHGQLDDGTVYIIMELLRGETLAAHFAGRRERGEPVALAEVVDLAGQIAMTLHAVHGQGIVHRDLKPENVFLVPDPVAARAVRTKILDFGIAMFLEDGAADRHTTAGLILGTPAYMSPEQCEGSRNLTEKVDVYALGVMLFEMLAGRPPFQAESRGALMRQHMFKAPPPLGKLVPEAPAPLCALIHEMLDKDPARRPSTQRLAQRFVESTISRPRRTAAARGAAGILAVAAIAIGVGWRWSMSRSAPAPLPVPASAPASAPVPAITDAKVASSSAPPDRDTVASPAITHTKREKPATMAPRRVERQVQATLLPPVSSTPSSTPSLPLAKRPEASPESAVRTSPPDAAAPPRPPAAGQPENVPLPQPRVRPKEFTDDDVRPHI